MTNTHQYAIRIINSHQKEPFLVKSKFERLRILREIMEARTSITAYFEDLDNSFITILLNVNKDNELIEVDSTRNHALNKKIVNSNKILCATTHANIKVEFVIERPRWLGTEEEGFFRCALPETMIRLQRREFFRVPIPAHLSITCHIQQGGLDLRLSVHDISAGGIGARYNGSDLKEGEVLKDCEIKLPDTAPLRVDLEVRNCRTVPLNKDTVIEHIGFCFVNTPGHVMTQIQKYIFLLEREASSSK